ncbi:PREDICTED: BTB/POZ and TAZ domain-containing protein 4-like [Camelina sativa]|uniref:BTB/POZ and TAZ domain-containing protein 4-like n=1 Tax=Camelina sativa TaxID=90675 RepID=A0ABM0X0E4_CAMSA|nr:PREDICTED: BTB/POZ and TAZ domain-containing protein 4-like [Camelina sativa]
MVTDLHQSSSDSFVPIPPPLPSKSDGHKRTYDTPGLGNSCISTATRDLWDRLFNDGYKADVVIYTDSGNVIYAHANIIGNASTVIKGMLKQAKRHGKWHTISIRGVPHDAVRVFIRLLYSSCYGKEEMNEFIMYLLLLSHAYVVPQLKRLCEWHLEHGLLNTENVIDVFQLALLCDFPRLSVISHRMIVKHFKELSATEAWTAMKKSHPFLEKEVRDSVILQENSGYERLCCLRCIQPRDHNYGTTIYVVYRRTCVKRKWLNAFTAAVKDVPLAIKFYSFMHNPSLFVTIFDPDWYIQTNPL